MPCSPLTLNSTEKLYKMVRMTAMQNMKPAHSLGNGVYPLQDASDVFLDGSPQKRTSPGLNRKSWAQKRKYDDEYE